MTSQSGNGSGHKGGFAGLVHNALEAKRQSGQDEELQVNKAPSKGLPSTGLKKNTAEWQQSNGKANGQGKGDRPSSSRQTSSSSIPSDADGEEDPRTDEDRTRDQEGPLGRGPGRHEPELKVNGGSIHDSPVEEKDMPSIPAPRGSAGDGRATPAPPEYFQDQAREDIPDRDTDGGKDGESHGTDGTGNGNENGIDPEERVVSRNDKKIAKRFTDETGHYPEGLLPVKDEAPPGSQNEIELHSRTPLIHVSQPSIIQLYVVGESLMGSTIELKMILDEGSKMDRYSK